METTPQTPDHWEIEARTWQMRYARLEGVIWDLQNEMREKDILYRKGGPRGIITIWTKITSGMYRWTADQMERKAKAAIREIRDLHYKRFDE